MLMCSGWRHTVILCGSAKRMLLSYRWCERWNCATLIGVQRSMKPGGNILERSNINTWSIHPANNTASHPSKLESSILNPHAVNLSLKHFYNIHSTNGKSDMLVKRTQVSIMSEVRMCLVIVLLLLLSLHSQTNALCLRKLSLQWVYQNGNPSWV